jgi:hypothetical protein
MFFHYESCSWLITIINCITTGKLSHFELNNVVTCTTMGSATVSEMLKNPYFVPIEGSGLQNTIFLYKSKEWQKVRTKTSIVTLNNQY